MYGRRRLRRLVDLAAELLNGVDGFEDALDDLAGAGFLGVVGQPALEQLGVGQNDPELIVQPVKEPRPIRLGQVHNSAKRDERRPARQAPGRSR